MRHKCTTNKSSSSKPGNTGNTWSYSRCSRTVHKQNKFTIYISAVANATSYTWTVPTGWSITSGQGGISIGVSTSGTAADGNITVTASNGCGTSSTQTLAIKISSPITVKPLAITGQTTICEVGRNWTYSIPAVNGATSYLWNVPSTLGTISGDASSNTINISLPLSAKTNNISVQAVNACGTGPSSDLLPIGIGTFAYVKADIDNLRFVLQMNSI